MKDCCLTRRIRTRPPGDKTGHSNPRCYARDLMDCSHDISREHYISRGLLELWGRFNLQLEGAPWAPETTPTVSVNSMTSKILCRRHNEALSPLDSLAKDLFEFVFIENHESAPEVMLINGYELERWFLKTLCGLVAAGMATRNGQILESWKPELEWLDILFGDGVVSDGSGLQVIVGAYNARTHRIDTKLSFKTETGQPIGLAFAVFGILFFFDMETIPDLEASGSRFRYRPSVIQYRFDNRIREVHFGWRDGPMVITEVATMKPPNNT